MYALVLSYLDLALRLLPGWNFLILTAQLPLSSQRWLHYHLMWLSVSLASARGCCLIATALCGFTVTARREQPAWSSAQLLAAFSLGFILKCLLLLSFWTFNHSGLLAQTTLFVIVVPSQSLVS